MKNGVNTVLRQGTLLVLCLLVSGLCVWAGDEPLQEDKDSLLTGFSLLVGSPSADAEGEIGVIMVPGVVIPLDPTRSIKREDISRYLEGYYSELSEISGNLQKTMRLEEMDIQYHTTKNMIVGMKKHLTAPASESGLRIEVSLTGTNGKLATYNVVFTDNELPVVDTNVSIEHGKRAVVGGMDGDEAPYYFLVIEPLDFSTDNLLDDSAVTMPSLQKKVNPQYPEFCRKNGIDGNVILKCIITDQGIVDDISVLKSPHEDLSQAAMDAVKQWKFEPSLLDGKPVDVYFNVTLQFKLSKMKKTKMIQGMGGVR